MKNILVTGGNGQLGHAIQKIVSQYPGYSFLFTDSHTLNLTDKEAIASFFASRDIDYVINCAAYTAVDKAESDIEMCRKINAEAVGDLSEACARKGARFIHISTDYVFDGTNHKCYTESDATNPKSVYGHSKLDGELLALKNNADTVVIRTAWLYSEFGSNFMKTMIRLGNERDRLNVVVDQIGTPTYASDLVDAIMAIVTAEHFVPGIFHFSNEGVCSWYDFTLAIHRLAGITCEVSPIDSVEYPTPAQRPYYSVLSKKKIRETYGIHIPHWEKSLVQCIETIKNINI
ncbi:MAG: dTDP-4-dehydrorhamnose reductase [Bacteroidales bacterium]